MNLSVHKIRHLALQALRRFIQLAVVVLIAGLAFLSLYAHYRAAHALEDETQLVGLRGSILTGLDDWIGSVDDPQMFLDNNKGTIWSMRIGGLDLTDPLAAAEATTAGKTIYGPLVLSILAPVLVTAVLGKVFCSWICPAGLLFEVADKLRSILRLAEIPPAEVRFSRANKYVLLAVGLGAAAVVGLPLFALVYPPAVLSRLVHAWIFGTSLAGTAILLGLIVVVEVVLSPRWWCRTMCPGGALYGLIGWPRLLRVKLVPDRCTQCRLCEPACQPGLNPVLESYGIECDNCGECVRKCPEAALSYTIGLPRRQKALLSASGPPAPKASTASPRPDGSAGATSARSASATTTVRHPERSEGSRHRRTPSAAEILRFAQNDVSLRCASTTGARSASATCSASLILVAVTLWSPSAAFGHHILGLPHYSYKENYPQVPVLEYPASTGPYEVLFVCYPGKPVPGEPANLVFDIKDGTTGERYGRPITVRLLQTFTFGNNREILPATEVLALDVLHKLSATFPEDGEYVVELTMDVEGQEEVIGFLMVAGDPSATTSVLVALGCGLGVFLITVRAIKKKRDRRLRKQEPEECVAS